MFRGLATVVIGVIIVLITLGVVVGALLGETDLFSPTTSAAEARGIDAEIQVNTIQAQLEAEQHHAEIAAQQAADALDLEHQSAIYAEEQSFLKRQYELQLEQQQRVHERELAWMETRQIVYLGVGLCAIGAATISVVYYVYTCGRVKLLQALQAEEHARAAEESEKGQGTQQLTSAALKPPVAVTGTWMTPGHQNGEGGNGRGETHSLE